MKSIFLKGIKLFFCVFFILFIEIGLSHKGILSPKSVFSRVFPEPVRGIYVTSYIAASKRIEKLRQLVKKTELNAMVLDINSGVQLTIPKKFSGQCVFPVSSPLKAAKKYRLTIQQLKKDGIYLIARIVTFKNDTLAHKYPEWALKKKDGTLWQDSHRLSWIDPYKQESWQYAIALGDYAVKLGFDEIQYDYVRFPDNMDTVNREVKFDNPENWNMEKAINSFLHKVSLHFHERKVAVSADVFGIVIHSRKDIGIGQHWDQIVHEMDIVCPMVYPSHYAPGIWGIQFPDLHPGDIISRALHAAVKRNDKLKSQGINPAKVRPWLQSFTAVWVKPHQKYGIVQIREQILAAERHGITTYLLWSPTCHYPFS